MHKIRASQIVYDIRSGMSDDALMKKHSLAPTAFQRVLQLMVKEKAIEHEELYEKSTTYRIITDLLGSRGSRRIYVPRALAIYHGDTARKGVVRDISEDGVRVAGIDAQAGDVLTLSMPLTEIEGEPPLEFPAVCRWAKTAGKNKKFPVCGFQITESSEELRNRLRALIEILHTPAESQEGRIYTPLSEKELSESLKKAEAESKPRKFSGTIDEVDILDVVQFMLLSGKKTILEIRASEGDECEVHFDDGRVVHASKGEMEGKQAFLECMELVGGKFATKPIHVPGRQSIYDHGDFLLFEAARRRDESAGHDQSPGENDGMTHETLQEMQGQNQADGDAHTRWYPFAPFPIHDLADLTSEGDVVEMSEKWVNVSGINARVGQKKILLIQAEDFARVDAFRFEAVCRWTRLELSGASLAGFEITHIEDNDREQFKNLLKLLAFSD